MNVHCRTVYNKQAERANRRTLVDLTNFTIVSHLQIANMSKKKKLFRWKIEVCFSFIWRIFSSAAFCHDLTSFFLIVKVVITTTVRPPRVHHATRYLNQISIRKNKCRVICVQSLPQSVPPEWVILEGTDERKFVHNRCKSTRLSLDVHENNPSPTDDDDFKSHQSSR